MSQACSARAKRVIARLFIANPWDWVSEENESGAAVVQVGTQFPLPMRFSCGSEQARSHKVMRFLQVGECSARNRNTAATMASGASSWTKCPALGTG